MHGRGRARGGLVAALVASVACALVGPVSVARAQVPGINGQIVYVADTNSIAPCPWGVPNPDSPSVFDDYSDAFAWSRSLRALAASRRTSSSLAVASAACLVAVSTAAFACFSCSAAAAAVAPPSHDKAETSPAASVGEAAKHPMGGQVDLTYSAGAWSGKTAFDESGIKPKDIKYASIYDSFTITVVMQIEDLGFCEKGQGGKFVSDGNLISGVGKLPFNTDGGGLCSNHPGNRGGMTKVLEAVRQLRGEAHPKVQVKNCDLALAHGTGGSLGTRHVGSTVIMERE